MEKKLYKIQFPLVLYNLLFVCIPSITIKKQYKKCQNYVFKLS